MNQQRGRMGARLRLQKRVDLQGNICSVSGQRRRSETSMPASAPRGRLAGGLLTSMLAGADRQLAELCAVPNRYGSISSKDGPQTAREKKTKKNTSRIPAPDPLTPTPPKSSPSCSGSARRDRGRTWDARRASPLFCSTCDLVSDGWLTGTTYRAAALPAIARPPRGSDVAMRAFASTACMATTRPGQMPRRARRRRRRRRCRVPPVVPSIQAGGNESIVLGANRRAVDRNRLGRSASLFSDTVWGERGKKKRAVSKLRHADMQGRERPTAQTLRWAKKETRLVIERRASPPSRGGENTRGPGVRCRCDHPECSGPGS